LSWRVAIDDNGITSSLVDIQNDYGSFRLCTKPI
jgi:hypothetical protein